MAGQLLKAGGLWEMKVRREGGGRGGGAGGWEGREGLVVREEDGRGRTCSALIKSNFATSAFSSDGDSITTS